MQFDVLYFETWGSTQPYVAFSALLFCSYFFVFGGTHTTLNSLKLHEPVSVLSCITPFYLAREWCLSPVSCGLRSRHIFPPVILGASPVSV